MGTKSNKQLFLYYLQMDDGRYLRYQSGRAEWDSWNERVLRVWREGPKGGVKLMRDRRPEMWCASYIYITQNKEEMKDFMWAKLSAKESKFLSV